MRRVGARRGPLPTALGTSGKLSYEMSEERPKVRLSAVLMADIAGYTKLIEKDTAGTVEAWTTARSETIDPTILSFDGRIVKHTGDGFLAEFGNVQSAVECAMAMQEGLKASRLRFRIGIGLGDIVDDGQDIHGEGVNVAARIEAMAEPGGICISGIAYEAVRNRVEAVFDDLGEHTVKHVSAPVRVYGVARSECTTATPPQAVGPALPDKPSIAVLPFQNMSADPEQEYFADGIVEDIITELSRNRFLFVIARNSSFTFKGRTVDVKQVGRKLGVRYVLEGSVRKAGSRVRITGQLIDTSRGAHLWANRFDGQIAEIFDLQDQVTQSVVASIAPQLELAEIERSKRKPTEDLDAYDYYLRGMAAFHRFTRESNQEALSMFTRACDNDPEFAAAYGMAARTYAQRAGFGWVSDYARVGEAAKDLARKALALGGDDATALGGAGFALVLFGETIDGDAVLDRALDLNPNLAWIRHTSGFAKALAGAPEQAVERATHAMRLSPQDPQQFAMQATVALGHFLLENYDEACACGEAALRTRANFLFAAAVMAASAAMSGRSDEAARAMLRVREINPELARSTLGNWLRFHRREDADQWEEALRRAGLPD